MRDFSSSSLSLECSLLIAHPGLLDPNFRRSVLFLSTNDAQEGSFGLILNRPAGRTVGELLPDQPLGELGQIPVFVGGPVSTGQLIFSAFTWHSATQKLKCRHHLVIEEARAAVEEPETVVRAFIGYAGWSKGQLENELGHQSWLVQKPSPEVLDLERCPTLWRQITSRFGPWFQLVAEAPDDASLN